MFVRVTPTRRGGNLLLSFCASVLVPVAIFLLIALAIMMTCEDFSIILISPQHNIVVPILYSIIPI